MIYNIYMIYSFLLASVIALPQPVVWETATVTAYSCGGIVTEAQRLMNCPNGITASGTVPKAGRTVACDKSMLGQEIEIKDIGVRTCEDLGGMVTKGRIDLYVDNIELAYKWGVKQLSYKIN